MFGLHVTVVRGDEKISPDKLHLIQAYLGKYYQVKIDPTRLIKTWQFWSLHIDAPELEQLRHLVGFTNFHRFHLTIGRQYDWQINS